jgi:hypothetical protein
MTEDTMEVQEVDPHKIYAYDAILHLPHGLGVIQKYIYDRMIYPSKSNAGVAAMAFLQTMASGIFRANIGQGDLALNEMYMVVAPTGFGKEDLRKAIRDLINATRDSFNPLLLPKVIHSLPASQQGLHDQLIDANGIACFMADEFGEWLADTKREGHKQQCVAYLMQAYTSPFSTVSVPYSSARKDKVNDLVNPRVTVFATSTWDRMGEVMTSSQGNSGAYNRFVIHIGEQHQLDKKYEVKMETPNGEIIELLKWIGFHQGGTPITFDQECKDFYRKYDQAVVEKLKFKDPALAGRLSEQAIRLAAVIALSDKRLVVNRSDLDIAYGIRLGMYHRARAAVDRDGLLTGMGDDNLAVEQITNMFKRRDSWRRSDLVKNSRAYERLSVPQKAAVCKQLETNGVFISDPDRNGWLIGLNPVGTA